MIYDLKDAFRIIENRVKELEEERGDLETEANGLQAKVDDLETEVKDLKAQLQAFEPTDAAITIDRLKAECDRLRKDRAEVKPYLEALVASKRLHPGGYTLVDFQNVWLEQEQDLRQKAERERDALRAELDQRAARDAAMDIDIDRIMASLPPGKVSIALKELRSALGMESGSISEVIILAVTVINRLTQALQGELE